MAIFSRRPRDGASAQTSHRHNEMTGPMIMNMNTRPTFRDWLKVTWPDLVTMVVMGILGLGIYEAHPAPSRSFPVYFQDGEIVYPQFAYPLRHEIVPIWAAALLGSLVPIIVILLCQIRIRSFWDTNNAIIGLFYSLITAAVFQVFLKWLIGGLRPHFLTVCAPSIPPLTAEETSNSLRMIMYDRTVCTGNQNEIDDSLESFPSGHTTAAFAGFVFLSIYLNAKLKLLSNYHPAMWKLIAVYAPILGATLIGGALTIDEYHNWYDCLAGAIIGTVMAFSSYRMVYASIWDWKTNHVPLNRAVPFPGVGRGAELEDATFTRQVGWGGGGKYGKNQGVIAFSDGDRERANNARGSNGHPHENGAGLNQSTPVGSNGYRHGSGLGASPVRKPVGGYRNTTVQENVV